MKHLEEYRDQHIVKELLGNIRSTVSRTWHIMEICGGQTHGLVKNGILNLLPEEIVMIHGPGCPVCVTPIDMIDKAINLSLRPDVILCSFGDMLRVPGSTKSLLKAKAEGASVRIVYSPLDALKIARENTEKEIVFFAVGFETTAPANALSVANAYKLGIKNYSILSSHVLVPPAMEAILTDPEHKINGFLAAGHVCTVMGTEEYNSISSKYLVPVVVTGFEPVDLLQGINSCVKQLEKGQASVENQYARVVKTQGNVKAKAVIFEVFEIIDREWRGIGKIPRSGYQLRKKYADYDAIRKFGLQSNIFTVEEECMAGDILKGHIKPIQCPYFGVRCTPENPLGAPMVSSEGACAAYYHYGYESINPK